MAIGVMHTQLGPTFQAVVFSTCGSDESLRGLLEKIFQQHHYDPSYANAEWQRSFLCNSVVGGNGGSKADSVGFQMDVPKLDLFAELPIDCIDRMVSETRTGSIQRIEALLTLNCNT